MDFNLEGYLLPNITTLIVQILSTGVLVFFFMKFFWKPLCEIMDKRAGYIESKMNEANEMHEKAQAKILESEEIIKEGALEYKKIIDVAKKDALRVKDNMLEEAKAEVRLKVIQAERLIESEKRQAEADLKQEMIDIILETTKQMIGKELDSKTSRKLMDNFVKEVEKHE
jgi:ATP synthase, F0 subunit b